MRRIPFAHRLCLLLILAALPIILGSTLQIPPRVNRTLHVAIGKALAKETLELLGAGGKIIVITRDTETFPQPALDILLGAFQSETARASANIEKILRLQVDPLRPVEVPSGDFIEQIRRAGIGAVIVSLLGPPMLTQEEWKRLGTIKPKIVAFCPGRMAETIDLRQLFDSGFVHAGVIGRSQSRIDEGTSSKFSESFEKLYQCVSRQNRSDLSSYSR